MPSPFAGSTILIVGPVCIDLTAIGPCPGGSATYASLTARNLGADVRVVTACGPGVDLDRLLPGIRVHRKLAPASTTFRNTYVNGTRQQTLAAWAGLMPEPPVGWRQSSVVLLGPLAQDVPVEWIDMFPDSVVGLAPQGWLREWDGQGQVRATVWPEAEWALERASATILSPADIGNEAPTLASYIRWSRLLVVTQGSSGATVHQNGQSVHCPAYTALESDPTGAGDVFAAAFLLHLARFRKPTAACDFANCVASFAVEAEGIAGVPTWEQVQRRWKKT